MTILLAALIAACAQPDGAVQAGPTADCVPLGTQWRTVATEDDRRRLREYRDSWTEALEAARADGHSAPIAAEGALLDVDAALADPMPPDGDYDCRTIKIGARSAGNLSWIAYPAFRCTIRTNGDRTTFTKMTGSQRPIGRLLPDSERRLVFLGTMQLGDETRAYRYGLDRERDMIGALERVGERRWRIAFPYPHFESLLDVVELIPRDSGD